MLFFLAAAGLLVFAIYANTFHSPFIFDDWQHIEGNPHIRMQSLTIDSLNQAAFASPLTSRPLSNVSFAFNYLAQGYRVTGYHLVNILIHLASGILVFLLFEATLVTPAMQDRRQELCFLPWVAALLWIVHPLHTQSVTYIVQRMNSMSAMFYLLAFFCYVKARLGEGRGRQVAFAGAAILAWLCACASKEIAIVLPGFVLLYEWFFIDDLRTDWSKRQWFMFVAVVILVIIAGLVMVGGSPWQAIRSSYAIRDFSMSERLLTQPRVIFFYLSLLLFPHPSRLNLDHDFLISHSLFDPASTVLSLVGIMALLVFAAVYARRYRLASFAVFWFLGNLFIESSVFGLEIIFEHRTYLPSVFPAAALVMAAAELIKKFPGQSRRAWVFFVALAVLVVFSCWTFERNEVWKDEESLRLDCLTKSPLKARNHAILANVYERRGEFVKAAEYYRDALRLNPKNSFEIYYNLGNVLLQLNDYAGAVESYRKGLNESPETSLIRLNLGVALERQGNLAAAQAEYEELLRRDPGFVRGHNNLGSVLLRTGRFAEAASHFREALQLRPDFAAARANLDKVLTLMQGTQGR